MKYIWLDFETYYDKDYSLRRMTPVEYILDPRFEIILCAVAENDGTFSAMTENQLRAYLARQNPHDCAVGSHNALFDMCILKWKLDFDPALYIDTMGMAQALVFHKTGYVSLDKVSAHLGIGKKGGTVHNVVGMTKKQIIEAGIWDEYAEYSCNDGELCRAIYKKLRKDFPLNEILINDLVIRCATHPRFKLNPDVLAQHLANVEREKLELLDRAGISYDAHGNVPELMSNEKFAELLRGLGVEPPKKISLRTGQETYAFAKTDHAMIELEEHDDPIVQALVAARLGHKSTLEETRTNSLLRIAMLEWPNKEQNRSMPVPLKYGGAHTHRLSGTWKLNEQNMTRGSALRFAHEAPAGHKVITVDSSQVEARVVAWLSGCWTLLDLFSAGADVYSTFASEVYGYEVNKKDHPTARFVGKQAVLGLGFGMGAPRFYKQVISDSHKQGITLDDMTEEFAHRVVKIYRDKYPEEPAMWKFWQQALPGIASGTRAGEMYGPVTLEHQRLKLPSGLHLFYDDLQCVVQDGKQQWQCQYGRKTKYLFGGKVTENVVQSLARILTMDAAVRIRSRLKPLDVWLNLQAHDELVYIVPDDLVNVVKQVVYEEMLVRPDWAKDLPLDAEVGVGQSYGDAK